MTPLVIMCLQQKTVKVGCNSSYSKLDFHILLRFFFLLRFQFRIAAGKMTCTVLEKVTSKSAHISGYIRIRMRLLLHPYADKKTRRLQRKHDFGNKGNLHVKRRTARQNQKREVYKGVMRIGEAGETGETGETGEIGETGKIGETGEAVKTTRTFPVSPISPVSPVSTVYIFFVISYYCFKIYLLLRSNSISLKFIH